MTILGVQPSHFGQKLGGTTQTSSKSFGRHPEKNNTFFGGVSISKLQIEMGSENKVPQNPMVSNLFPGTLFSIFRYLIIQWL